MANAILEKEIARITAERDRANERFVRDSARKSDERAAFNGQIRGNYQRLMHGDINVLSGRAQAQETVAASVAPAPAYQTVVSSPAPQTVVSSPAPQTVVEEKPKAEFVSSAAERLAQYTPVKSASGANRRVLFEGLTIKNGQLYGMEQKQEAPAKETAPATEAVAVSAPAAAPVTAPVTMPEADAEDAIPTRRTMDTLRRAEEEKISAAQKERVSYALSSKMKLVIATVALVIMLAIAIICVNTAVINSLNADIAELQAASQSLAAQTAEIEGNIADVTAWENVMEFAKQLGMILPN